MKLLYDIFDTSLGAQALAVQDLDGYLTDLVLLSRKEPADALAELTRRDGRLQQDCESLAEVRQQIGDYLLGERTEFDLKIRPAGTPFQKSVWDEMRKIPYGETRTYGELAGFIERPKAPRAVGAASGANPIWVIIPCHRVVGSDGSLTGYGGGLDIKKALLQLEKGRRLGGLRSFAQQGLFDREPL